jgi:hypothetical protein
MTQAEEDPKQSLSVEDGRALLYWKRANNMITQDHEKSSLNSVSSVLKVKT